MDRRLLLLVAVTAAALSPGAIPRAYADRLGGNYRGPGDAYLTREDPPAARRAAPDPLLASLGLDRPFLAGLDAGRAEAAFRGRPLLVFLVLPGCSVSASVAETAFRDPAVVDLVSRFVPVVVDAEKAEEFGVANRVRTLPTILLLDAAGREVGRAEGAVDAGEAGRTLRDGLRRAGAARPTAAAKALESAGSDLARARRARRWSAVLETATAIERAGRDGPELDAARVATAEAADEAAARLDAADRLLRDGSRSDARRALVRIADEFDGLAEAARAREILLTLDGIPASTRRLAGNFRPVAGTDVRNSAATIGPSPGGTLRTEQPGNPFDPVVAPDPVEVPLPEPPVVIDDDTGRP